MIDMEQSTPRREAGAEHFRRGADAAKAAEAMWPDPEVEAMWQEHGRRNANPLLTAALDLLDEGFAVLALGPRDKVPLWGGVRTGWIRSARKAVDRWGEVPDANVGVLTGVPWRLVVIDLDGPEALEWWAEFQREHGTMSTRTVQTGRAEGGLHLHFGIPENQRHLRLKGGNGLLAPGVDVKVEGGYVVAPPSVHPSGRRYEWLDHKAALAPLPDVLRQLLAGRGGSERSESLEGVRDHRGIKVNATRCPDGLGLARQVEGVETTDYGRRALRVICDELARCPEGGGLRGGRDPQAYWSYGRAGYLVGSELLNPGEALDALAVAMDANGLGSSRAKLHRFWERVVEGIETPLRPPSREVPGRAKSADETGLGSMSDLADTSSSDLPTAKSDSTGEGEGGGDVPSRSSRTRPTASRLAIRLWDEGTFCHDLKTFSASARRIKTGPAPCGRMDCRPCQRRLLAAWAETAARWLHDHGAGCLQMALVEPRAWPTFHRRLHRADAQYFKVPTADGLVVLFWSVTALTGSQVLADLQEFEARLEAVWWANRSMATPKRVDTSAGWQPPKKGPAKDEWHHLGVRSKAVAENIARQFIPEGSTMSPRLDDQQLRSLLRVFPEADPNQFS